MKHDTDILYLISLTSGFAGLCRRVSPSLTKVLYLLDS